MATLVLSTVGTALGGPVGSAIGALIGQSIDQELLAPTRRGPRVGDLTVQSSSYGTPIPRIYGTMRVAGSVIWATDLLEHANTDGAKGQPDVAYSYTVSLAVALSSRPIKSIKRIWADGKLLRGAGGDFKVGTKFRFYDGGDEQEIDSLIGSAEGISSTPAYRGLALAVFEDLALGEFGNRIPFFTFEVEADDGPAAVGAVLTDVSSNAIVCTATEKVVGFAAYGRSIHDAVQPLADCFGIELFDDGAVVRSGTAALPVPISERDLGNSADDKAVPRIEREQQSARAVPATLRLTYYDPGRDYQTGEARAVASELLGNEAQQELAAVLDASDAKSIAQRMLASKWASRDKLTLRLPLRFLGLEPGRIVELPLSPRLWTVRQVSIDGFVAVAELSPSTTTTGAIAADSGRIAANPDTVAGPLSLAVVDIPNVFGAPLNEPTVLVGVSGTGGPKTHAATISVAGQIVRTIMLPGKSVLGRAVSALPTGSSSLVDTISSVDVEMVDVDQWLISCDDGALAAGANLAVLGGEVVQFGIATALGGGRFRLSRFLRGRAGTEWACTSHEVGDVFCLLPSGNLQPVTLPGWSLGAVVRAEVGAAETSSQFSGEGLKPPSPVGLTVKRDGTGGFSLKWTRRSRSGFLWIDGVDAPLGEARELYRVIVSGTAGAVEANPDLPTLSLDASAIAALGAGPALIEVSQIGDFGASRPAQMSINL